MANAVKLTIAMVAGAFAVPVLAYVTCGNGVPADVIRILWAFVGAGPGLLFEVARRDLRT